MTAGQVALLLINLIGGLAFFIYGMKVVSESLQGLAGSKLRDLLFRLTRNRVSGLSVGTMLGFTIHSGAATILLVTFIHAGMLTLINSVPVMLGANVGTTLSMQLISFKVGQYAPAAVGLGVLMKIGASKARWKHIGGMLFGFGLIFLGMDGMSAAVIPLKNGGYFEALIRMTDSGSVFGFALALGLSVLITTIFQSSGATIGILFALCHAGIFTRIDQVFPLVIGAHIGTCSATLIGAVGTNIEARRAAYSHLLFNVLGTLAASLMAPLYYRVIPLTSGDLVRQVANTHTIVQSVNALLVLPLAAGFAKLTVLLTPSKEAPPERSFLEEEALNTPELAIASSMREARRMAVITRRMLVQAMAGLLRISSKPFTTVIKNENVVDTLKRNINDYLQQIAGRRLSTRQSILLQHLMVTVTDLERIGDHVETIVETTEEKVAGHIWFDQESMRLLVEQFQRVDRILRLTIMSLDPELRAFKQISAKMLELRREFMQSNRQMRDRYRQLIVDHKECPINGLYYERYLRCFERIVRHTKSIARLEQQTFFKVKPNKFSRKTELVPHTDAMLSNPLPVDEKLLDEELSFDDLGIDPLLLEDHRHSAPQEPPASPSISPE